jgi:hypothetical protein
MEALKDQYLALFKSWVITEKEYNHYIEGIDIILMIDKG